MYGGSQLDARQERAAELAVQGVRLLRRRRQSLFEHDYSKTIHAFGHITALEVVFSRGSKRLPH